METGKDETEREADTARDAVFAATIRPHRSLGPEGFRILMVLCTLVAGAAAIRMIALGFWPVSGFLILDVVGLYVAFKVNYARGRSFEELVLTPIELMFRRTSHRGAASEWRLNPLWTRLHRVTHEEFGLQHLALVSRGQEIQVARDLSPGEREHLADEFGKALARVKRGY